MKILIIGAGALGGTMAIRLSHAGLPVHLAVRRREQALLLRESGLRLAGAGGEAHAETIPIATLEEYSPANRFDLIFLATKAPDALAIAGQAAELLNERGMLVPLQNGCAQLAVAARIGSPVVGGIAYLGARMLALGKYEQGNTGHFIFAEPRSRATERAARIADALKPAIKADVSDDFAREMWAKLAVNCSVTSVSAIMGNAIRHYLQSPRARDLLFGAYEETLAVANAAGVSTRPQSLEEIAALYGDLRPSMLQDIDRGRTTEVDFINGYVVDEGMRLGVSTPLNAAIVARVHAIEMGHARPGTNWEELISPR